MVDALDSKSCIGNNVWVRVPPSVQAKLCSKRKENRYYTEMAELVDAHVSEACGVTCAGSTPAFGTH